MSDRLLLVSLPAALASLAVGYTLCGLAWVGLGFWLAAVVVFARPAVIKRLPAVMLPAALILATLLGVLVDAPPFFILLAVICGLAWWDLAAFNERTRHYKLDVEFSRLERTHLNRLGLVLLAGFIISTMALWIEFTLTLIWAVAFGMAGVVGLQFILRAQR